MAIDERPDIRYMRHYYRAESSFTHLFQDSNATPVATDSVLLYSAQIIEMGIETSMYETKGDKAQWRSE